MTITPLADSVQVKALCAMVVRDATPLMLMVDHAPDAMVSDCFHNVNKKVDREGGAILYGWDISEWVGVLVEAEYHAVWLGPDGPPKDVSPNQHARKQVLFLPDPSRIWTGEFVDNVRFPLFQSGLFADLDTVSKLAVSYYNQGARGVHGIELDGEVFRRLNELKSAITILLSQRGTVNSPCPCGSGLRYKRCHRTMLEQLRAPRST
jgi:hypothetical protein